MVARKRPAWAFGPARSRTPATTVSAVFLADIDGLLVCEAANTRAMPPPCLDETTGSVPLPTADRMKERVTRPDAAANNCPPCVAMTGPTAAMQLRISGCDGDPGTRAGLFAPESSDRFRLVQPPSTAESIAHAPEGARHALLGKDQVDERIHGVGAAEHARDARVAHDLHRSREERSAQIDGHRPRGYRGPAGLHEGAGRGRVGGRWGSRSIAPTRRNGSG